MGSLFSSPKSPKLPEATPVKTAESKEVQEARAEALARRRHARGFRASIVASQSQTQGGDSNDFGLKQTLGS